MGVLQETVLGVKETVMAGGLSGSTISEVTLVVVFILGCISVLMLAGIALLSGRIVISFRRHGRKIPYEGISGFMSGKQGGDNSLVPILDSIMEGYVETDLKGVITVHNASVGIISGCISEDLRGRHIQAVFDSLDIQMICESYERILESGTPEMINTCVVTGKDGVQRVLEVSASLVCDSRKPSGFRGVIRDVTDLERVRQEKKRLEEQLNRAQHIEAIGALSGGIAHDFNNLLMGIQGNVSIMLFNMSRDHAHYKKLINIEDCIRSGSALTKQLLGFARRRKTKISTLAVTALVKEALDTFTRTKKEIQVHDSYQKDLWPVQADRGQIEQVVINLFINSWHSMPGGKELCVSVSNIRVDGQIHGRSDIRPGNYVKVQVANSLSVLSEEQSDLFEPVQPKEIKTGAGSGFGLASSFGVVRSYDGIVDFKWLQDGGSAYTVCFPAADTEVVEEDSHETVYLKGSGTVLFVDDEEMIVQVGKPMLEELGYNVIVARGGHEAIKVYEVNKGAIDLVILDLVMPLIDGGEVFDILKTMNPEVKTLLSSGYSMDDRAISILDRGCDGFIQKPFNLKRLSKQIQEVMGK